MYDKERLIKAVSERLNLSISEAGELCQRVYILHPDLNQVISHWIETGEISHYSVYGITIKDIMNKESSNFIRALFSMSVLIKNPQFAKRYNEIEFD